MIPPRGHVGRSDGAACQYIPPALAGPIAGFGAAESEGEAGTRPPATWAYQGYVAGIHTVRAVPGASPIAPTALTVNQESAVVLPVNRRDYWVEMFKGTFVDGPLETVRKVFPSQPYPHIKPSFVVAGMATAAAGAGMAAGSLPFWAQMLVLSMASGGAAIYDMRAHGPRIRASSGLERARAIGGGRIYPALLCSAFSLVGLMAHPHTESIDLSAPAGKVVGELLAVGAATALFMGDFPTLVTTAREKRKANRRAAGGDEAVRPGRLRRRVRKLASGGKRHISS